MSSSENNRPCPRCTHTWSVYIFIPQREKIRLSSPCFPLPASSVFQPDSWFSVDAGVLAAAQPRRQEAAWSGRPGGGLCEADHSRRTPHLDGGVVAGGQQQLLVGRAERHRIHHVVVCQTRQTDVVVTVPDVAVLVLGSTTGGRLEGKSERLPSV